MRWSKCKYFCWSLGCKNLMPVNCTTVRGTGRLPTSNMTSHVPETGEAKTASVLPLVPPPPRGHTLPASAHWASRHGPTAHQIEGAGADRGRGVGTMGTHRTGFGHTGSRPPLSLRPGVLAVGLVTQANPGFTELRM